MKKIAITGNIASGKTQVENYLKQFYPVIDTDKIAHDILNIKKKEIISEFKDFDILENNTISRKKLGNLVFDNKNLKTKLEKIVHPEVKKEIELFFLKNQNEKYVFVGIPLLFEADFENLFDKIIFIYANDNLRIQRLINRNNFTTEEALLRVKSQISQEEKIQKSDFVIKNENSLEQLFNQIQNVLPQLE